MTLRMRLRMNRGDFLLDVNLEVPARGVTAIFGPSGCGKTTLLRAIAGLERDVTGYLSIAREVWQDGGHRLPPHRRPLGYVFQEASLFDHLSVQRNIEYGLRRMPPRARRVSLSQAVELLGIGHLLERRPHQLSGGERQRVAIARALAVSPSLLLLDEPLAALDERRKQEILPYLARLHQDLEIPVLYVSHSRDEVARLSDRLVLLEGGRVQAVGPVGEIFSRLDLPLAYRRGAETVIETVVVARDARFGLNILKFPGGRFLVADREQPPGTPVRLQVKAKDVSLALERPRDTSILNIFPATVETQVRDGDARMLVRLRLGPVPLLARITRKSAVELSLMAGKRVFAQIKSVAVLSA